MPELPEVETTRRGILPHIEKQTIVKVIIREYRFRWLVPSHLAKILLGRKIINVERRAKYLLLVTHEGTIIIHLGMSGSLSILLEPTPPKKHDHIDITFSNNKILRFTDPRRFGAFLWTEENPHQHELLQHLGVEPLTKNFTGRYLYLSAKNRKAPIKSFLMDNKIVTGIGNIYATEALFAAGIHPATPANSLTIERLDKLVKASKEILRQAIKRGGTTLKDFVNSDGKPGYFSNQLKVYGRAGQPCVACQTSLHLMQIGQRSTVYCKKCQSKLHPRKR